MQPAQLKEERRRSAYESVRRELRDYYASLDRAEHAALVAALDDLEREWPHLYLTVKRHVGGEQSFEQLAQAWRVSNGTVIREFQRALSYLSERCRGPSPG